MTAVTVARVGDDDLADLLPLLRAYCVFYGVAPSNKDLLVLCRALIADPDREGLQLIARDENTQAVGFATIYWTWSTTQAGRLGVMNDLFVAEGSRGAGVAEALIDACRKECASRGVRRLRMADRTGEPSRPSRVRADRSDQRAMGRLLDGHRVMDLQP